jgi:phosphoglycerate dehydrogenase-like enzyme
MIADQSRKDSQEPTAPTKLLLGWHATADELALVRSALDGLAVEVASLSERRVDRYGATAEEMLEAGADAELVLTWVLPDRFVEKATRLRFVSWMHHGYDRLPAALLRERGVAVANLAGEIGALDHVVTEQAWALLLACAKRLVVKDQAVRTGTWWVQPASRSRGRPWQ